MTLCPSLPTTGSPPPQPRRPLPSPQSHPSCRRGWDTTHSDCESGTESRSGSRTRHAATRKDVRHAGSRFADARAARGRLPRSRHLKWASTATWTISISHRMAWRPCLLSRRHSRLLTTIDAPAFARALRKGSGSHLHMGAYGRKEDEGAFLEGERQGSPR